MLTALLRDSSGICLPPERGHSCPQQRDTCRRSGESTPCCGSQAAADKNVRAPLNTYFIGDEYRRDREKNMWKDVERSGARLQDDRLTGSPAGGRLGPLYPSCRPEGRKHWGLLMLGPYC